jgi:hypothetical protein
MHRRCAAPPSCRRAAAALGSRPTRLASTALAREQQLLAVSDTTRSSDTSPRREEGAGTQPCQAPAASGHLAGGTAEGAAATAASPLAPRHPAHLGLVPAQVLKKGGAMRRSTEGPVAVAAAATAAAAAEGISGVVVLPKGQLPEPAAAVLAAPVAV